MIVKVSGGGRDFGGLAAYLWGGGKAEEHTEQRMIASTGAGMTSIEGVEFFHRGDLAVELGDEALDSRDARRVGARLERHWRQFVGAPERVPAGGGAGGAAVVEQDRGLTADVPWASQRREGRSHVFHVSFSLAADEGELTDEAWSRIAAEYVEGMGFAGGDAPDCEWAAWRHGRSNGGNDHMHLAVCLVRPDGRWASEHRSFARSRTIVDGIEQRHGLRPVKERSEQRGMPGYSMAEAARSGGRVAPGMSERDRLATIVRSAAARAGTERQWMADVLRQGVRIRPRFAKGGQDEVVGYSVRLRDGSGPWLGGRSLAGDLSLPTLRRGWEDTPEARRSALEVWRGQATVPEHVQRREASWNAAQQAIARWATRVAAEDLSGQGAMAGASRDAASLWAQLASSSQGQVHEKFAAAAATAAAAAQYADRSARTSDEVRVACRHLSLMTRAGSPSDAAVWLAVVQQMGRVADSLGAAHAARGEARRAHAIAQRCRADLAVVERTFQRRATGPQQQRPVTAVTSSTTHDTDRGR